MPRVMEKYFHAVKEIDPIRLMGVVNKVIGLTIETKGPEGRIGELCRIHIHDGRFEKHVYGEIIGFNNRNMTIMPYYEVEGISPGCEVRTTNEVLSIPVSEEIQGRILNGIGHPLDSKSEIFSKVKYPIFNSPPDPLTRDRITQILPTGIRAIDAFLTIGKGQRIGVFAGSGVGKSTLMGMIARSSKADVNVIALIGERGREVREFIEKDLGPEGLKKSVLVVATSDNTPLMRVRGAYTATAIAEYFRDLGYDVNFMMDSVTRFCWAQREIGLSTGEPPVNQGFTPSVFTTLPRLLERPGNSDKGSITAFYTVLVEGDDFNEPITDTVRGVLDGHILLKRDLADKGHFPAIDLLGSVSRLMVDVASEEHKKNATDLKELYAVYREQEDLINIGAYQRGSNPKIDKAIQKFPEMEKFLRQGIEEHTDLEDTLDWLAQLNG